MFTSLLVLFLGCLIAAVSLRWLLLQIAPEFDLFKTAGDHIWVTFLAMTDPGNMNQDNRSPALVKVATITAGFSGVVIFSMLIAFITTFLEDTLAEFRKGRGRVFEEGHTLILGWNERVTGILHELILANESERDGCVVILAEAPKERMDDEIVKAISDSKTTRIITSQGNPVSLSELNRVNAGGAKSAIVLASCSESADDETKANSDTRAIKVLMALLAARQSGRQVPVVAEIFHEHKRELVEVLGDDAIITLNTWDIMGKLFVQTALSSGLEMVYNEILSFDGAEVYLHEASWGDLRFGDLPKRLPDGIPLGVLPADGELVLRPAPDRRLRQGDRVAILAEDDSTIALQPHDLFKTRPLPYEARRLEKRQCRQLILGWHDVGDIILHESEDYLQPGSEVRVIYRRPSQAMKTHIQHLQAEHSSLKISLYDGDPMSYKGLKAIDPFAFDNVIILSQNAFELSPERVDSDTLMILLLLRKVAKETGADLSGTKIITQILNADNADLIVQTDVDDFIISNKLITMLLAQISEQPEIKKFYDDIFREEGSEIYVKPAHLYFPQLPVEANFIDVMAQAAKRQEICLGIRRGAMRRDAAHNFGVRLNLPKGEAVLLGEDDFLVVLAEDEL